jgi:hypothetical protein
MLPKFEDLVGINPNTLKSSVSIEKTMIVHVDPGFFSGYELTVEIYDLTHFYPPEICTNKYITKENHPQHDQRAGGKTLRGAASSPQTDPQLGDFF